MASALDSDPEQGALSMVGGTGSIDPFSMPFQPGEVIVGKYKAIRLIGTGGVGFVVSARHVGFDEVVALKFLRPEFASHGEAVMRFTIEARASFKIKSEHVARVLDVDTLADGTPFIVMELLEGSDLRSLLDRRRLLSVEAAVDCALQVCEALAAAHMLGIIHRDIKPENLFLIGGSEEVDQLKVLDFGISKVALTTSNGRQTHPALTRIAVGTPPYMSPEQVRASSSLDARSDLWSLGCVLYECLTGTAPFDRLSLMQSCAAVLEEEPSPPRDLRPNIPVELDDAVMRCLQKDATMRFADVAELAEIIAPFGSGRFAGYETRCRSFLNGDGPNRLSTPTPISAVTANAAAVHTKPTVAATPINGGIVSASMTTRRATQDWAGPNQSQVGRRQQTDLHAHQPIARAPRASLSPYSPQVSTSPRISIGVGLPSPQAPVREPIRAATDDELRPASPRRWPVWIALITAALGGVAYYSLRDQIEPAITAAAPSPPMAAAAPAQPSAGVPAIAVSAPEPAPSSEPSPSKDTLANPDPAAELPLAAAPPEPAPSKAKPHSKSNTNTNASSSSHKSTTTRRSLDEPDVGF
jgi:serine/threonine protein kinase